MKQILPLLAAIMMAPQVAAQEPNDPLDPLQNPTAPVGCIDPSQQSVAVPVTPIIQGNGPATWVQLYQDPHTGTVYASWGLTTNNLNNGADDWVFGMELNQPPHPGIHGGFQAEYLVLDRGGICRPIGFMSIADPFTYFIDAGAGGWSGTSSCTVSFHWQVTIGVKISMTDSSGSIEGTIGGSMSCSNGIIYDSESLLRDRGTASLTCVCLGRVEKIIWDL